MVPVKRPDHPMKEFLHQAPRLDTTDFRRLLPATVSINCGIQSDGVCCCSSITVALIHVDARSYQRIRPPRCQIPVLIVGGFLSRLLRYISPISTWTYRQTTRL
jgi:hypothetical protein